MMFVLAQLLVYVLIGFLLFRRERDENAFVGSRWFTWRHRPRAHVGREYALFVIFSALAAAVQLACLLVARHALGLTSPLADNISGNVVGMALATVLRFWTFRTFVFPR